MFSTSLKSTILNPLCFCDFDHYVKPVYSISVVLSKTIPFVWFGLALNVLVNSYGHVSTISSPYHTVFSWAVDQYFGYICLLVTVNNPVWIRGREDNDCRNYFMINLHESMGPGQDQTHSPYLWSRQLHPLSVFELDHSILPISMSLTRQSSLCLWTWPSLNMTIPGYLFV